jgi:hypothetical protein
MVDEVMQKNEQETVAEVITEQAETPNDENISNSNKLKNKEVIYIGDAPSSKGPNLQSSFLKFRDQKIKEMQMVKMVKQASLSNGRTTEFKAQLRLKFVEQLKRYLGVPYGVKYKAPEDPIAPLYLDCCALVRQAVQDLQDEFGFIIGKWNQSYQIDTLPIVLTPDQLRPGDLIFYEGAYLSKRSKPQKHNIVHVEVFLGDGETGEECIGSRYHRGKVSLFPSYQFTSTTWSLVNYHFRSLDTWLDGVCKSFCGEHDWQSDAMNYVEAAGKRSIFSDNSAEDDVEAGGDEIEDDTEENTQQPLAESIATTEQEAGVKSAENEVETTKIEKKVPLTTSTKRATTTATTTTASTKAKRPSQYRSTSNNELTSSTNTTTSSKAAASDDHSQKTYYINKSNGWKLVKDSLDRRGWTQLPFDFQFTTKYSLKWVERRSQIDYRAHRPGQLVCHIPNNDILCTKIGLLTAMRDTFCRFAPPVLTVLEGVETAKKVTTGITTQPPWLPLTFDLEAPRDVIALLELNQMETERDAEGKPPLWIYKPPCRNRGRGIKVIAGDDQIRQLTHGKTTSDPDTTIAPPVKGIVQRYLSDPLLVSNCKFDIRCYLLIARNFPTTIAFYHPGYCRMALKAYNKEVNQGNLDDAMVHLTNASIQKQGKEYQENADAKAQQIQSITQVANTLQASEDPHLQQAANYMTSGQLDVDIKRCMVDILKAGNTKLLRKHGFFDLFGCDFMLAFDADKKLELFLLEMNTNPALSLDNAVLEELLPRVVDGALELVLKVQGPEVENLEDVNVMSEDMVMPSQYQLLLDEARDWTFTA